MTTRARKKSKTERERYHDQRAAGLCVDCASAPLPGRARCEPCLDYVRRHVRAHRAKKIAKGLCGKNGCDTAPRPGFVTCDDHLTAARDQYEERTRGATTGS